MRITEKESHHLKKLKQKLIYEVANQIEHHSWTYLRSKCGNSNSTSTSRTSLQKGEPCKERINISN